MAALPDTNRRDLWAQWMRANKEAINVNKHQVRAVVDAVDDWMELNKVSLNLAIPQPARSELSAAQKAGILVEVVTQRWSEGA